MSYVRPTREQIRSMLERLPIGEVYTFESALLWCGVRNDAHVRAGGGAFAVLSELEAMVREGLLKKDRHPTTFARSGTGLETIYWRPNVLELLGGVDEG